MQLDLHEDVIAEAIVDVIKEKTAALIGRMDWLENENAALKAQIKALEDRQPIIGPQGEKGLPGDPGPPGAPGATGESGPAGAIGPAGPPGSPGERGEIGPAGPQGIAGRDGLPGVPGATGEKGIDGKDGARGPAGLDGQDGTLEDVTLMPLGRGVWEARYKNGEPVPGWRFEIPGIPHWEGVFDPTKQYREGAEVKWGGNTYIAKMDGEGLTPGLPGISQQMWDLKSERGRQGKTGDKGLPGDQGPRGEKGDRGPERW